MRHPIKPSQVHLLIIKKEMTNGFTLSHGGVIFSVADSCLAFAANSFGKIANLLSLPGKSLSIVLGM